MANGNGTGLTEEDFINLISDQFPSIIGNVESGVRNVFGKPGLSPEEEDRLTRLNQRAQNLQPIDIQGPKGSSRVGGNMYSYDVNPVVRGGQGVIENVVNAVRQKKLQGDPDQLKKSRQKIESAQQELKQLEKDSLEDMNMMGPGASDELTKAVSGDKKKRMQQLRRQIEQETKKLQEARGVQGQRANLLEKKEEAKKADQTIEELVANISPRVAQTMFDRQEQQERLQTQHDLTLEEIEARHSATMDEIAERNKGRGTGADGLPASLLDTLSENVQAAQNQIMTEVNNLSNTRAQLREAQKDDELKKTWKKRLPEGTTIEQRIKELDEQIKAKQERLERSVRNMIEVSAERNNLSRARAARLLGYKPSKFGYGEDTGGDTQGGGDTGGNQTQQNQQGGGDKTMTQADLEEYAENTKFNGDVEKARSFLESQGYTIKGN